VELGSFGGLTPTIDIFEVFIVIALAVGIPMSIYNVREAWAEKEWAVDDPDPAIRRLGFNRWENAQNLMMAMFVITFMTISSLMVPSAIQSANPNVVDFQDVMNAFIQRIGVVMVVLFLTRKCINDAIWRRDVDRRRKAGTGMVSVALASIDAVASDVIKAANLGTRLESALAENTAITEDARDRAKEAYAEANTLNQKIATLSQAQVDLSEQRDVDVEALKTTASEIKETTDDTGRRVERLVPDPKD
jgi:hypothetical protein